MKHEMYRMELLEQRDLTKIDSTDNRRFHTGFSLLELMVVVAIVGILAMIAYPAYTAQAMKGQRTDAKTALMADAQNLERCYTEYNAYNNAACPALPNKSPEGYYAITASTLAASAYLLTATPIAGAVVNDTDCATFTLDNNGKQSSTPAGNPCW